MGTVSGSAILLVARGCGRRAAAGALVLGAAAAPSACTTTAKSNALQTTVTTPAPAPTTAVTTPSGGGGGGGGGGRGGGTATTLPPVSLVPAPTGGGPASSSGCSLSVLEGVYGQPSSADAQQTASWTILRANNWTVFAPSGSWHLSASTAGGADVLSPDGLSDASLGVLFAQTPWTPTSVADDVLSQTSGVNLICKTAVEKAASGSGETQAFEVTGTYKGEAIHAIVVASVLATNGSGEFTAETRTLYTPTAQWSASAVRTLTLILKRAVFQPQSP